jgi:hypothetical protein
MDAGASSPKKRPSTARGVWGGGSQLGGRRWKAVEGGGTYWWKAGGRLVEGWWKAGGRLVEGCFWRWKVGGNRELNHFPRSLYAGAMETRWFPP